MPTITINWRVNDLWVPEYLDKPSDWGCSYFWFCRNCGEKYAQARIDQRVWRAVSGVCLSCQGDRWSIPGSLESLHLVGWPVPDQIIRYQLAREIAFLDDPKHPYNEKEIA